MTTTRRALIVVGAVATLSASPLRPHLAAQTLEESQVWYADLLRQHFPHDIENGGSRFPLDEIAALRVDITTFNLNVRRSGRTVSIQGSVTIRALPSGVSAVDGAQGRRYMIFLDAFIVGPNGQMLWKQNGFPQGGAWISAGGETKRFTLINAASRAIPSGATLIVLVAGDPIFGAASSASRVILGAKTQEL